MTDITDITQNGKKEEEKKVEGGNLSGEGNVLILESVVGEDSQLTPILTLEYVKANFVSDIESMIVLYRLKMDSKTDIVRHCNSGLPTLRDIQWMLARAHFDSMHDNDDHMRFQEP